MPLELILLGTGSPVHVGHRFGPSQVITDGTTRILVDSGWASTLRLVQAGYHRRASTRCSSRICTLTTRRTSRTSS